MIFLDAWDIIEGEFEKSALSLMTSKKYNRNKDECSKYVRKKMENVQYSLQKFLYLLFKICFRQILFGGCFYNKSLRLSAPLISGFGKLDAINQLITLSRIMGSHIPYRDYP